MTAYTKVSAKGQVVIPKEVRDRLDWGPGTQLEIEESADGLVLRISGSKRRLTYEEFRARRPRYEGVPASVEDMDEALLGGIARRWAEEEKIRRR